MQFCVCTNLKKRGKPTLLSVAFSLAYPERNLRWNQYPGEHMIILLQNKENLDCIWSGLLPKKYGLWPQSLVFKQLLGVWHSRDALVSIKMCTCGSYNNNLNKPEIPIQVEQHHMTNPADLCIWNTMVDLWHQVVAGHHFHTLSYFGWPSYFCTPTDFVCFQYSNRKSICYPSLVGYNCHEILCLCTFLASSFICA